jgi:hypothetical protein
MDSVRSSFAVIVFRLLNGWRETTPGITSGRLSTVEPSFACIRYSLSPTGKGSSERSRHSHSHIIYGSSSTAGGVFHQARSRRPIADTLRAGMLRAVRAAIDRTASFDAMPHHATIAMCATRRHGMDGTFKAVECHGLLALSNAKCLVVLVSADVTDRHGDTPLVVDQL